MTCRKLSHPTKEAAENHREQILTTQRGHSTLTVYLCNYCMRWHVGHRSHRRKKRDATRRRKRD